MDALTPDILPVAPTDPGLADLFQRHLAFARASSPACSVHSKEASDLEGAYFIAAFASTTAIAMGALVTLGAGEGEIKSMHVLAEHRGGGTADAIVLALLAEARRLGLVRVSLETGSQPVFAPARRLYARHGFQPTGPFADYTDDPNSYYMTRAV